MYSDKKESSSKTKIKTKFVMITTLVVLFLLSINAFALTNISNCTGLQNIENDLNEDYVLVSNIDCSDTINWNGGEGFEPIGGNSWSGGDYFNGTLDGQGYTISDFYINRNASSQALFEVAWDDSYTNSVVIKNLVFENSIVKGFPLFVGTLIGEAESTIIKNITVINGSVDLYETEKGNGNGDYTGGIIGGAWSYNLISDSYFGGIVAGDWDVGGITGEIDRGSSINNSWSDAYIDCYEGYCGGIVGYLYTSGGEAIVQNNFFNGEMYCGSIADSVYTECGGIIGEAYASPTGHNLITNNWFDGIINTNQTIDNSNGFVGGIIGYLSQNGTIENNYVRGTINNGNSSFGGIVGGVRVNLDKNVLINDNFVSSTITGIANQNVGGIMGVGFIYAGGHFSLSTNYWNNETDTISTYGYGYDSVGATIGGNSQVEPKTTTKLQDELNYLGWDFNDIWAIRSTINDGLPVLQDNLPYNVSVLPAQILPLYNITNCVELQNMTNSYANYQLMNDIDCTDTKNWNAGVGFLPVAWLHGTNQWRGNFDGQGYTIDGLFINTTSTISSLFGNVYSTPVLIENVDFTNVYIEGDQNALFFGQCSGNSDITFDNVHVLSSNFNTWNIGGGFTGDCGNSAIAITDSSLNYTMTRGCYNSGIADAWNTQVNINNFILNAQILDITDCGLNGGLFSELTGSHTSYINNVDATIYFNDTQGNFGGLIGEIGSGHTLYVDGVNINIVGYSTDQEIGGITSAIVGNSKLIVNNSAVNVDFQTTNRRVGGLVGNGQNGISNIYNTNISGRIIASGNSNAGVLGECYICTFDNVISDINISGQASEVGGLVGYADWVNVTNSKVTGNLEGNYGDVGGLIGYVSYGAIIKDSSFTGTLKDIKISGTSEAFGGLIGWDDGSALSTAKTIIQNSYADVTLSVDNFDGVGRYLESVGGLVGFWEGTSDSYILNSYSTGSITGNMSIGGIVGYGRYGGNVVNSYTSIQILGDNITGVGAIIGCDSGELNYENSFWNNETIGINPIYGKGCINNSDNATPITTDTMQSQEFFENMGWDFENIWAIDPLLNNGFPYLIEEVEEAPETTEPESSVKDVIQDTNNSLTKALVWLVLIIIIAFAGTIMAIYNGKISVEIETLTPVLLAVFGAIIILIIGIIILSQIGGI